MDISIDDLKTAALLVERWGMFTFRNDGARAHVPSADGFVTVTPESIKSLVTRLRAARAESSK